MSLPELRENFPGILLKSIRGADYTYAFVRALVSSSDIIGADYAYALRVPQGNN